jgi:hypothetical protein
MRNSALLLATPLLAACSTVSDIPPPEPPAQACHATGLETFIGQPANVDVAADIRRQSGARTFRWTGPGMAVTMDYRTDRVNAELDSTLSRIVGVSCG